MVSRGRGRLGCLFALLLIVTVLYYGLPVVKLYWDYYQLVDEMRSNARFASTMTDDEMMRRLRLAADLLDLPPDAKRYFVIRRSSSPPTVAIRTQYRETIELPFHRRVITLRPAVVVRQ
jgi:hypothetical protein